ncbi:unnamed protein product [Cuscuta europaea]|uniref:Uncharacterized protein n=1 Tax=Cuscuta europaea TaxID=41803 RepID=A0A9P0YI92_CUSEU|nr:unnamed protein product [Cuscuta europaea]
MNHRHTIFFLHHLRRLKQLYHPPIADRSLKSPPLIGTHTTSVPPKSNTTGATHILVTIKARTINPSIGKSGLTTLADANPRSPLKPLKVTDISLENKQIHALLRPWVSSTLYCRLTRAVAQPNFCLQTATNQGHCPASHNTYPNSGTEPP